MESLEALTMSLEKHPFATLIIDQTGRILQCNERFLSTFSLPREQVLRRPLREIYRQAVIHPPELDLDGLLQSNEVPYRTTLQLANGEATLLLVSVSLHDRYQGQDLYVITLEHRHIAVGEEQSQLTVRTALRALDERIALFDNEGTLIFANWLSEEELATSHRGQSITELCPVGTDGYLATVLAAAQQGETVQNQVTHNPLTGKTERIHVRPIYADNRSRLGILCILSTENREAENNARRSQLEQLWALGEIASATAHEIRNPLTAISALAQIGAISDDINRKNDAFKRIVKQIEDVNNFLTELTFLSKAKSEPLVDGNPHQVLEEVLELVQGQLEMQHVQVKLDLSSFNDNIPLAPRSFRQALLNIIQNAIEAMEGQAILRISSKSDGDSFILKISDSGMGIDPINLPKICTPFFTTKTSGTGLGLAITMQIIHVMHQGELLFASTPAKGTTVTIKIPLKGK